MLAKKTIADEMQPPHQYINQTGLPAQLPAERSMGSKRGTTQNTEPANEKPQYGFLHDEQPNKTESRDGWQTCGSCLQGQLNGVCASMCHVLMQHRILNEKDANCTTLR